MSSRYCYDPVIDGGHDDGRENAKTADLCGDSSAITDLALAFYDTPDAVVFLCGTVEHAFGFLELFGRNHHQHADAHVEGTHHVVVGNVAELLHVGEDRRYLPLAVFDDGGNSARQHARKIFSNSAPGDMCHRRHAFG